MRKLAIVLISFLAFSCDDKVTISKDEYSRLTGESPQINLGEYSTTGRGNSYLSIIVIDSCEYVGYLGGTYSDFLTHKGNCKFCAKRNENKVNK